MLATFLVLMVIHTSPHGFDEIPARDGENVPTMPIELTRLLFQLLS